MSSNKARRHTHKYHQVIISGSPLWACALPDCNHYMPLNMTPMVVGKASICWQCNEPMILDKENMKLEQPICVNCSPKTENVLNALEHFGVK